MQVADSEASVEAVRIRLEEAGTRYVRCHFIDYVGQARGREVSAEYFLRHLRRGVATAPVNYTWDVEDLDYDRRFGPEAGDVFLVPDASSLVVLPYLEGNAQVFCDVVGADGKPWPGCTRQALKKVIALTERELGQAAFG